MCCGRRVERLWMCIRQLASKWSVTLQIMEITGLLKCAATSIDDYTTRAQLPCTLATLKAACLADIEHHLLLWHQRGLW